MRDTTEELTQIQHDLAAAFIARDPSVHKRILAEDWSVTDPTGRVLTKQQVLEESFTDQTEISDGGIDDIKVRDLGDFAIVTGRTRMAGRAAGEEFDVTLRFTDVFTRQNGEWKCLASQGTFVSS